MGSLVMMSTTFDVSRLRTSFKSESNNLLAWDNNEDESRTCYKRRMMSEWMILKKKEITLKKDLKQFNCLEGAFNNSIS